MADDFGTYLASLKCEEQIDVVLGGIVLCLLPASTRQGGKLVCNAHIDNSERAPRCFATND